MVSSKVAGHLFYVKFVLSQKKPPKDSTRSTALGGSFWDVLQMTPYHKQLLAACLFTFITRFGE